VGQQDVFHRFATVKAAISHEIIRRAAQSRTTANALNRSPGLLPACRVNLPDTALRPLLPG
jgi:hypothetical protein